MLLGTFEQILNYVVVMDWLFFGLTASCIFVLRAREKRLPTIDDSDDRPPLSRARTPVDHGIVRRLWRG